MASADPEADADKASKILLMAQRAADATIDDANSTAQQTLSDARTTAAGLVAEAEAEAQTTKADAEQQSADELIEQRRSVVVREVRDLEELKTTVQSDIDVLEARLDEQRARIRRGVEALALVLDDPDGLRVDTPPTLHETTVDDVLAESTSPPRFEADDDEDDDQPIAVIDSVHDIELDDVDDEEESIVLNEGIDVSGVDLTSAPEPARAPGGDLRVHLAVGVRHSRRSGQGPGNYFTAVPDDFPDIDLAGDELFAAADRDDRVGPPTQAFKPFTESDDPARAGRRRGRQSHGGVLRGRFRDLGRLGPRAAEVTLRLPPLNDSGLARSRQSFLSS